MKSDVTQFSKSRVTGENRDPMKMVSIVHHRYIQLIMGSEYDFDVWKKSYYKNSGFSGVIF